MAGKADFLAFSSYSSSVVTTHDADGDAVAGNLSAGVANPYFEVSEWGWQMDLVGYRYWLNLVWDRYQAPLFDAESGLGTRDEVVPEDGVEREHACDSPTIRVPHGGGLRREHARRVPAEGQSPRR